MHVLQPRWSSRCFRLHNLDRNHSTAYWGSTSMSYHHSMLLILHELTHFTLWQFNNGVVRITGAWIPKCRAPDGKEYHSARSLTTTVVQSFILKHCSVKVCRRSPENWTQVDLGERIQSLRRRFRIDELEWWKHNRKCDYREANMGVSRKSSPSTPEGRMGID